mgnify:CR=1 FL=1
MTALDSVAWLLNIRGADVDRTPVALSYVIAHADGTADLFVASEKIGDDVRKHLGNGVRVHERTEFEPKLASLAGSKIVVDPERSVDCFVRGTRAFARREPNPGQRIAQALASNYQALITPKV